MSAVVKLASAGWCEQIGALQLGAHQEGALHVSSRQVGPRQEGVPQVGVLHVGVSSRHLQDGTSRLAAGILAPAKFTCLVLLHAFQ